VIRTWSKELKRGLDVFSPPAIRYRHDDCDRLIGMVRENEIREAEIAVTPPAATDAGLVFIGRIHTPWTSRMVTPRQGRLDGPLCRIEIFEP
jgi:hypothetical protein